MDMKLVQSKISRLPSTLSQRQAQTILENLEEARTYREKGLFNAARHHLNYAKEVFARLEENLKCISTYQ